MRLTQSIPEHVAEYIGLEFAAGGRSRDGLDCWGLVWLYHAERLGVALPSLADRYSGWDGRGLAAFGPLALEQTSGGNWSRLDRPEQVGDVLLFRVRGEGVHVALAVAEDRMLHVRRCARSCIERFDGPAWAPRLAGVYRAAGPVRVVHAPHPFAAGRHHDLPEGMTVAELLSAATIAPHPQLRVYLGDRLIPTESWGRVRPRAGRRLTVTVAPEGGGGGAGGKSVGRLIGTIAIIALTAWASLGTSAALAAAGWTTVGAGVGGALAGAAVGFGGYLALNALVPPARPTIATLAGTDDQISPTIAGARNQARVFGRVPVVLGEHRIAPPYAASPYTEMVGSDQYLRLLFAVNGPIEMSDFRIGDTPLSSYQGVEIETRQGLPGDAPLSLFPKSIIENAEQVALGVATDVTRVTELDADEISVDITFPQGLCVINADGSKSNATVDIELYADPGNSGTPTGRPIQRDATTTREMDFRFRTPEVEQLVAKSVRTGRIAWGLPSEAGWTNPFPDVAPTGYLWPGLNSWMHEGWINCAVAGTYRFALDSSGPADLSINGQMLVTRYGDRAAVGSGGVPNYSVSNAEVTLAAGWHQIRARVHHGNQRACLAVGWLRPGQASYETIPASAYATTATGATPGTLVSIFSIDRYWNSTISVTAATTSVVRRSVSWPVARGQYIIRLRRTSSVGAAPGTQRLDLAYLTAVRTIRNEDPIADTPVAKVALRIKATDQLNGVVDTFNFVARSLITSLSGTRQVSSNPADLYRHVLQGTANRRPAPSGKLDTIELGAWRNECATRGLACNMVVDYDSTVREVLAAIAAAGRASPTIRDGKYSVVRDRVQTVPVQAFTPRNSRGMRSTKAFPSLPHALRVRFIDKARNYQPNSIVVVADGYTWQGRNANGVISADPPATQFETIDAPGAVTSEEAWKHGRYYLAVARLRPEVHELDTDIESLVCTRGDLVLVSHDVLAAGLAAGRVREWVVDGSGALAGVRLDEECPMVAGKNYRLRVRLSTLAFWSRDLVTQSTRADARVLAFSTPVPAGSTWPALGDLAMFGELGLETREYIVKAVRPTRDLGATLTLVDYSPDVLNADQGAVPSYDPGLSVLPAYARQPDPPAIDSVRSDETVMSRQQDGSLVQGMAILVRQSSGTGPAPAALQVRVRPTPVVGSDPVGGWTTAPLFPAGTTEPLVGGVQKGVAYQVQARYIGPTGTPSSWTQTTHTVVGNTVPPPALTAFTMTTASDGTRVVSWSIGTALADLAGVELFYGPPGSSVGSMTQIGGVWPSAPFEATLPPPGTWRLAARAVDAGGLRGVESYIDVTLGAQRSGDIAFLQSAGADGWNGTITNGVRVAGGGGIEASDPVAWSALTTWSAYTRWIGTSQATPVTYTHPVLDVGSVVQANYEVTGTGVYVADANALQVRWSIDNVTWSAWADGRSIRAAVGRYWQMRWQGTASDSAPIRLTSLQLILRAPPVSLDLADLDTSTLASAGPGDVRLPLQGTVFQLVRRVALTFRNGGQGWSWVLVDRDPQLGPRIRIFDASGQPAHAVIDATITGN
jgi:cell wall-associated NlpC family hydrolase